VFIASSYGRFYEPSARPDRVFSYPEKKPLTAESAEIAEAKIPKLLSELCVLRG